MPTLMYTTAMLVVDGEGLLINGGDMWRRVATTGTVVQGIDAAWWG